MELGIWRPGRRQSGGLDGVRGDKKLVSVRD